MKDRSDFVKEIASCINGRSLENLSDTPDFILAECLVACLEAISKAIRARDEWYGKSVRPLEQEEE